MKLDALDQLELYEEAMGKRGIIATSSSAQETRGKGEPGGAIQISGLGPFQGNIRIDNVGFGTGDPPFVTATVL
jgi:hypothetical protein